MGVNVDKPRGDDAAGGIDFPGCLIRQVAHGHDAIADDADIHHLPGNARAIYNQTTRDFEIKHRQSFYLVTCPSGGFPAQLDQ